MSSEGSQRADRPAPQQLAIALAHRPGDDGAPEVVASGRGLVAEQILQIAFAAGVKVRTDADLANLLSLVDIGEEIPAEAFVAVAEVLAYIYRAGSLEGMTPPAPTDAEAGVAPIGSGRP